MDTIDVAGAGEWAYATDYAGHFVHKKYPSALDMVRSIYLTCIWSIILINMPNIG